MNPVTSAAQTVRSNIDAKTVTSVVAGLAVFGGLVYMGSQVKALRSVVKVVKGGK